MNIYNNFGFGNSAERIKNMEREIFVNMTQIKYALDIKDSIDRTKVYDSSALIYPERGSLQTEFVFEQTDSVSAVFKYAEFRKLHNTWWRIHLRSHGSGRSIVFRKHFVSGY